MLRIECPWCGVRDEPEFSYGGESHIARPPDKCSDEEWAQYLFFRANPKGSQAERWCHSHGCGQWFNLLRDTVTHEIVAVYRMGEPHP
jgi:heterotetrameric sarcosine oxidase delta subunit